MIDRKALWFSITVIVAMLGGAFWRLGLLPDWHRMTLDGPGSPHAINGLFLFVHPLALAVATASLYARKWLNSGTEVAVQPWRQWSTILVIAFCVLLGLMQAFLIIRSLGYLQALDRVTIARIAFGGMGLVLMATGNVMPKLPWLATRFRALRLNPWQQNRHLRFTGKLMVAMGLYFLLMAIALPLLRLLPKNLVLLVVLVPGPLVSAASLWHRALLKREPSPQ